MPPLRTAPATRPLRLAPAPTPRRAPRPARAADGDDAPPPPPKPADDGTFYNDERSLPPRSQMSDAYKKKLRDEYLSLGGSPNTAMGSNYYLWIIGGISFLAILTWATGNL